MNACGYISLPSAVAHNTQPRLLTGGGNHVGDSARITQLGSGIGSRSSKSDAARTTLPTTQIGGGSHVDDSARITLSGSGVGGGSQAGDSARITQLGSGIVGSCLPVGARNTRQPHKAAPLLLYKDSLTNPLPSDYGFIAASLAAQLQHGHVNPLSKE